MLGYIGDELFGVYLLLSMFSIASALSFLDLGLGISIQYFISRYSNNILIQNIIIRYAIIIYLLLGLTFSIILYSFSGYISHSIDSSKISHNEIQDIINIIAINLFFQFISVSYKAILEGAKLFYIVHLINIISFTLQAILIIIIASIDHNINNIFKICIFITILEIIILYFYLKKHIIGKIDYGLIFSAKYIFLFFDLIRYSTDILINRILGLLNNQVDKILIWKYLTPSWMVIYEVVTKPLSPIRMITQVLNSSLIPEFSELNKRKKYIHVSIFYARLLKYSYMLIIPIAFAMFVYIDILLKYWVGDKYSDYAYLSYIVIFIYLTIPLLDISGSIMAGTKSVRKAMKVAILSTALNIVISIVLIFQYKLLGLLLGTLISTIFLVYPYNKLVSLVINVKTKVYLILIKYITIHIPLFIFIFIMREILESIILEMVFLLFLIIIQYFVNFLFLGTKEKKFLINKVRGLSL